MNKMNVYTKDIHEELVKRFKKFEKLSEKCKGNYFGSC